MKAGGRRRRLGAGVLLATLAGVQAIAFAAQIRAGFRPFAAPGARVPFSWDMFAGRIERCDMRFDPPLPLGSGVARLRDVAPALEWDPVFSQREDYEEVGRLSCTFAEVPTRVFLRCFTPEGEVPLAFPCP